MSSTPSSPSAVAPWINVFLGNIPYCRAAGMELVDYDKGRARIKLPARPTWTGDAARQLIHPGCSSVLADTACGMAVSAALEQWEPIATLDLRMDYLRPAPAGAELLCAAECFRLTRNIGFVRGDVFCTGEDEPVATVIAAFMRSTASGRRDGSRAADAVPQSGHAPSAATLAGVSPDAFVGQEAETPALPPGVSPYVDYLGVRKSRLANGAPLFRLPFHPDLIGNPILPALHGGVLAGFAETALVLHIALTAETVPDSPARGVDFSIDYLRSAKPVDTFATCTTVRQGSRVALVQVMLWQDDPNRPIATARGHLLLPQAAA